MEEAFNQGASARPDDREDLKSAMLSLAMKPIEGWFLQVYPVVGGLQTHFCGVAVKLQLLETVQ